jgi:NTP pyrophosphatase (non-canonical NTP hydrolase)
MRTIKSGMSLGLAERYSEALEMGLSTIEDACNELNDFCYLSHGCSRHAGWWDDERNFGELIALIHSEISEAMEGGRKDDMDGHLPDYSAVAVELADAVIRIGDLAGALGIPLGDVVIAKMKYNAQRSDHKRENRAKVGGKQF